MRGGQVSIEYIILIGLVLVILLPLVGIYYSQSARFGEQTAAALATRATTQIVQAADSVYYLGPPSIRTITVELPEGIHTLEISGQSITLLVEASHTDYEQVAWSAANLTGNFSISAGPHVLVVTALADGRVNITE